MDAPAETSCVAAETALSLEDWLSTSTSLTVLQ